MVELVAFVRTENDFVIGAEFDARILVIGDFFGDHGTNPDGHFDSGFFLFPLFALRVHFGLNFIIVNLSALLLLTLNPRDSKS